MYNSFCPGTTCERIGNVKDFSLHLKIFNSFRLGMTCKRLGNVNDFSLHLRHLQHCHAQRSLSVHARAQDPKNATSLSHLGHRRTACTQKKELSHLLSNQREPRPSQSSGLIRGHQNLAENKIETRNSAEIVCLKYHSAPKDFLMT